MIGILATVVFAAQSVTVVLSGAARYPSGVNPALCPNYPHCDNVLLAAYAQPAAAAGNHYAGGAPDHYDDGQYSSGYQHHPYDRHQHREHHQQQHYNHQQPAALPYTEPGYPAGLTSSNCPNYPYCSHQVPAEALRYAQKQRYY